MIIWICSVFLFFFSWLVSDYNFWIIVSLGIHNVMPFWIINFDVCALLPHKNLQDSVMLKELGKKTWCFFFKSTSRQKYGLIGHSIKNSRFTKICLTKPFFNYLNIQKSIFQNSFLQRTVQCTYPRKVLRPENNRQDNHRNRTLLCLYI